MNKLSKQEQEVCYILSNIFNYYASYIEILGDIRQTDSDEIKCAHKANKEECLALFRVKQKYKTVKKQILDIKNDFNQTDLDRLFYITAWYCLGHKYPISWLNDWCYEESWDKDKFIDGITKVKKICWFHKKYLYFRVKNHYKILCFIFGFTKMPLEKQKKLLKKDNSIHFPTLYEKVLCGYLFMAVALALLIAILKIYLFKE